MVLRWFPTISTKVTIRTGKTCKRSPSSVVLQSFFLNFTSKVRPSDRVRGCGTAQFGQTRTITHNSQNTAKSRTILKDSLKHLIKSGILLIAKIPKNLLGYFQAVCLPKQSRNPSLSSIAQANIKRKAFFRHSAPAWALVSVRSTFCQLQ